MGTGKLRLHYCSGTCLWPQNYVGWGGKAIRIHKLETRLTVNLFILKLTVKFRETLEGILFLSLLIFAMEISCALQKSRESRLRLQIFYHLTSCKDNLVENHHIPKESVPLGDFKTCFHMAECSSGYVCDRIWTRVQKYQAPAPPPSSIAHVLLWEECTVKTRVCTEHMWKDI